jgi:hypothetical protein
VRYGQALLLLAASAAVVPSIRAETLYVIEQLVVNVNSAPDATGQRVATIKSGSAVEVLERHGDQVHVHLPNGTEGWVRKSYLSAEEPLQLRLDERNAEVQQLKQDVTRLEHELTATRTGKPGSAPAPTTTTAFAAAGASTPAETNSAEGGPPTGEPAYFMTPPEGPARPVWHWALASFMVALGLGFALGWYMLDRRIRRKYGGLRIY